MIYISNTDYYACITIVVFFSITTIILLIIDLCIMLQEYFNSKKSVYTIFRWQHVFDSTIVGHITKIFLFFDFIILLIYLSIVITKYLLN